ncbi:FtsX-like permease family protein [uncultured Tenacibaculum sp.]|uniref:ABC transporter permease n=1 Tax=uncultured Tenacibaculum sp. TaxID=174713 RepID=UPI0026084C98|nr:FtsX-like permease family protein [uncultured Tenacibaculum sp.]
MNFPLYIAKRYLRSKNSTNAVNIITIIAMLGVIIGTLALFIILSGFSGLRNYSYSMLDSSDPDIKITARKGKSFLYTKELDEALVSNTKIADFSKVLEERAFLKYGDKNHIAYIKGVDVNYTDVLAVDSILWSGDWINREFKNTAVVGYGIYNKLSIQNYLRPLVVFMPKPGTGIINPNNAYRSVNTQVTGIYGGSEEFRNKFVFTELHVAQELMGYEPNKISGVELKVRNPELVDDISKDLQKELGDTYKVQTRAELNELILKVINTENFVSYLIFTLIVIIALFNLIGAIIMMIIDKRKNLKTLLNIGASVKDIKRIFVLQGSLLSVVGMLIGLFIGISLVFLQKHFGWFKISPELAYPVEFKWFNLITVVITILTLGFLASKIAGSRITKEFIES